jgi:hypothetical protein
MAAQATAATYESELARFTACGQQQVFRFWKTLNAEQQAQLVAEAQVLCTSRTPVSQITQMNWPVISHSMHTH